MLRFLHFFSAVILCAALGTPAPAQDTAPTTEKAASPLVLLIVLDGFRPDYIDAEKTPHLHGIAEKGVVFENHHAIFPTVTRQNAATMVTGAYPQTHGLLDNTVYFPDIDAHRPMSTSDAGNLQRIDEAVTGQLLTASSLGEILHEHGKRLVVCSAGSTGSAFLLNHRAEKTGAVYNPGLVLPEEDRGALLEAIGPAPPAEFPNSPRNHWAVRALLDVALPKYDPAVAVLWLSDPDHTAHAKGMGAPETEAGIDTVDTLIGELLARLEADGRLETTQILVTSDHGFVSYTGEQNPYMTLRSMAISLDINPNDVIFSGSGIYFRDPQDDIINRFVAGMQELDWMGPIFTEAIGPGIPFGKSLGTLSLDLVRHAHARAPHILYATTWGDDENAAGIVGHADTMGIAGHGGFSPHEVHALLLGAGSRFKSGVRSPAPSDHADLAPTILHLLQLPKAPTMEGRILQEGLKNGPDPKQLTTQVQLWRNQFAADFGGEAYIVEVKETRLGDRAYHDYGKAWRGEASPFKP